MNREPFRPIDGEPYARWWTERFEPPADPFARMTFYQRGRHTIWVGTADIDALSAARVDTVGIHLLRIGRRYWKPTSAAIVAFAADARRAVIELTRNETIAFLAGRDVSVGPHDPRRDGLPRGFLAARHHGVPIGCAEWHDGETLASLIPKNRRVFDIDM